MMVAEVIKYNDLTMARVGFWKYSRRFQELRHLRFMIVNDESFSIHNEENIVLAMTEAVLSYNNT